MNINMIELYNKCKDCRNQSYPIFIGGEIKKIAIYYQIKAYFFQIFGDEGLELHERSTVGGDWLLYEWNRYLDEIAADEKMQTLPELNDAIDELRGFFRYRLEMLGEIEKTKALTWEFMLSVSYQKGGFINGYE